ncbi:hypothetical protein [Polycladidibacter stylochi]|uniref:hypothetical protein n=1 Tax=Polycladidibacter stylochi TaxID=1807766 RepID=UPI00082A25B8|nr:hypothetical protein [Pseudovibrio stylochi]
MTGRGYFFPVFDKKGNATPAKYLLDHSGNHVINQRTGLPYVAPADYTVEKAFTAGKAIKKYSALPLRDFYELAMSSKENAPGDLQRSLSGYFEVNAKPRYRPFHARNSAV